MKKIISFIYSLIINIKLLGIKQGIKIPVLINYKVKVNIEENARIQLSKIEFGIIRIGFGGSKNISPFSASYLILERNSILSFQGKAIFSKGVSIRLNPNSQLIIGDNFSANRNFQINVDRQLVIGKDVLIGWNVLIQDGNGHSITYADKKSTISKEIVIGSNVWISSYAHILGGSSIKDNSVIAMQSLCNKDYPANSLIGGIPAHYIKSIDSWSR